MNPYEQLRRLLPQAPLLVGRVLTHTAAGESMVELPDGAVVTVRGTTVPTGQMAYLRAGQVQGEAPNITPTEVTV